MSKYIFKDGYIELKPEGNTYVGKIAHLIMHKAEFVQRKSSKEMSKMFHRKIDVDFNTCLLYMIKASYEKIDQEINLIERN